MYVRFVCPNCDQQNRAMLAGDCERISCTNCEWDRAIVPREEPSGQIQRCVVCGCNDLWRQKDFPQKLGLFLVGLGALLSTLAWAWYMPRTALGVLLAFALVDMLLYTFMKDVLVCYRCHARYGSFDPAAEYPRFNLETAERYRQEAARLSNSQTSSTVPPTAVPP